MNEVATTSRPTTGCGLVLSGGGAKGAYQVGVVKAIVERGVLISAISGTSIGALNGALLASSSSLAAGVEQLEKIWRGMVQSTPNDLRLSDGAVPPLILGLGVWELISSSRHLALGTQVLQGISQILAGGHWSLQSFWRQRPIMARIAKALSTRARVLDQDLLLELLDKQVDPAALRVGLPLYVSVFRSRGILIDLTIAGLAVLNLKESPSSEFIHIQSRPEEEWSRWVLASAALPLVFDPQVLGEDTFIDGGLGGWREVSGNTPAEPLCLRDDVAALIVTHLEDGSTWNRHSLKHDIPVIEIRPVTPIARRSGMGDVVGFTEHSVATWIEAGYQAGAARLDEVMTVLETRRRASAAETALSRTMAAMEARDALADRVRAAETRSKS